MGGITLDCDKDDDVRIRDGQAAGMVKVEQKTTGEYAAHVIAEISSIVIGPGATYGIIPADDVVYRSQNLVNGAVESMVVNGAITPQSYKNNADGFDWYVESVNIFMNDNGAVKPDEFGHQLRLTNGLQLNIKINGTVYTVLTLRDNMDFITKWATHATFDPTSGFFGGDKSIMAVYRPNVPILMKNSTGDYIEALVRDDLSVLVNLRVAVSKWRIV